MDAFALKYSGTLHGLLHWGDWDRLRGRLLAARDLRWFAYAVGTEVPRLPLSSDALRTLLGELDVLLHRDHDEDYLGIVYVDDPVAPSLIKIDDPNNLGSTCGSSDVKVEPGWVLSLDAPSGVAAAAPLPGNRRRWWASLWQRF
jgi:hypothetical protein